MENVTTPADDLIHGYDEPGAGNTVYCSLDDNNMANMDDHERGSAKISNRDIHCICVYFNRSGAAM